MEVKYIKCDSYKNNPNYLISIDIGYSSTGLCIYDFKNKQIKTLTPKLKDYLKGYNTKNVGIPEYLILSNIIRHYILKCLEEEIFIHGSKIAWSLEIPNIVGTYSCALGILVKEFVRTLSSNPNTIAIFLTHNRLGGYYLRQRSFKKNDIKELLNKVLPNNKFKNEHERDAFLQCYTVLNLAYDINLCKDMRTLEGSSIKELSLWQ